jgi:hypothetical protein
MSDPDWMPDAEQCADLADEITLHHREKYLKEKGRSGWTKRKFKQYLNSRHYKRSFAITIHAAIKAAEERLAVFDSDEQRSRVVNEARLVLEEVFQHECHKNSRPHRTKGLIASVAGKPSKKRTRPNDEQRWMYRVLYGAISLWAKKNGFDPHDSLEHINRVLVQDPDGLREVKRLMPSVIRDPDMQQFNLPSKSYNSLFQRARQYMKAYPLPQELRRKRYARKRIPS